MKKLRAGYRAQVAKKTKEIDQLVAESDEDEAIITLLDIIKQKWEYEDMVNLEILASIDDDLYEEEQYEQESAKDERVLLSGWIDRHFRKVRCFQSPVAGGMKVLKTVRLGHQHSTCSFIDPLIQRNANRLIQAQRYLF